MAHELDRPSRIIAVSDVFQALTQPRPYRAGMPLDEALEIVESLVESNQLDKDIFECLKSQAHECYQLSIGENSENVSYVPALTVGEN